MISIAIDGPASAGKSTVSRRLAGRFGFLHVDTGALYRTIGLAALRKGVPTRDAAGLEALLPELVIDLKFEDGKQKTFLSGEDVTEAIRSPEADMAASDVSAVPAVRSYLLGLQRDLAERHHVIMDGRDIGTVVLPGATVKIFLTASPEERARRRYLERKTGDPDRSYEAVLAAVRERDYNDSHRKTAPLKQAEDAWRCDTTDMDFEASVEAIARHIGETLEGKGIRWK